MTTDPSDDDRFAALIEDPVAEARAAAVRESVQRAPIGADGRMTLSLRQDVAIDRNTRFPVRVRFSPDGSREVEDAPKRAQPVVDVPAWLLEMVRNPRSGDEQLVGSIFRGRGLAPGMSLYRRSAGDELRVGTVINIGAVFGTGLWEVVQVVDRDIAVVRIKKGNAEVGDLVPGSILDIRRSGIGYTARVLFWSPQVFDLWWQAGKFWLPPGFDDLRGTLSAPPGMRPMMFARESEDNRLYELFFNDTDGLRMMGEQFGEDEVRQLLPRFQRTDTGYYIDRVELVDPKASRPLVRIRIGRTDNERGPLEDMFKMLQGLGSASVTLAAAGRPEGTMLVCVFRGDDTAVIDALGFAMSTNMRAAIAAITSGAQP